MSEPNPLLGPNFLEPIQEENRSTLGEDINTTRPSRGTSLRGRAPRKSPTPTMQTRSQSKDARLTAARKEAVSRTQTPLILHSAQQEISDEERVRKFNLRRARIETKTSHCAAAMAYVLSEMDEIYSILDYSNELKAMLPPAEFRLHTLCAMRQMMGILKDMNAFPGAVLEIMTQPDLYGFKTNFYRPIDSFNIVGFVYCAERATPAVYNRLKALSPVFDAADRLFPCMKWQALVKKFNDASGTELPTSGTEYITNLAASLSKYQDRDFTADLTRLTGVDVLQRFDNYEDAIGLMLRTEEGGIWMRLFESIVNQAVIFRKERDPRIKNPIVYEKPDGLPVVHVEMICKMADNEDLQADYELEMVSYQKKPSPSRFISLRGVIAGINMQPNQQIETRQPIPPRQEKAADRGAERPPPAAVPSSVTTDDANLSSMLRGDSGKDYFGPINAGQTMRAISPFKTFVFSDQFRGLHFPAREPVVQFSSETKFTVNIMPAASIHRRFHAGLWVAPSTIGHARMMSEIFEGVEKPVEGMQEVISVMVASMIATVLSVGEGIPGGGTSVFSLDPAIAEHKEYIRMFNDKAKPVFCVGSLGNGNLHGEIEDNLGAMRILEKCNQSYGLMTVIVGSFIRNGYLLASGPFPASRYEEEFSKICHNWYNDIATSIGKRTMDITDSTFSQVHNSLEAIGFKFKRAMTERIWDHAHIEYAIRTFVDKEALMQAQMDKKMSGKSRFNLLSPPVGLASDVSAHAVLDAINSSVSNLYQKDIDVFLAETSILTVPGLERFLYSELSQKVLGRQQIVLKTSSNFAKVIAGSAVKLYLQRDRQGVDNSMTSGVFGAQSLQKFADEGIMSTLRGMIQIRANLERRISDALLQSDEGREFMGKISRGMLRTIGFVDNICQKLSILNEDTSGPTIREGPPRKKNRASHPREQEVIDESQEALP